MVTVLYLIVACINFRPLAQLSTDPNDLRFLKTGSFLIGAPLLALPEYSVKTYKPFSLFSRWKLISLARDEFWRKWNKTYLQSLTSRKKWNTLGPKLEPGQFILLKIPSSILSQWTFPRIVTVNPGVDNIVRAVKILTAEGIFTRPISQISLLPNDILPAVTERR